MSYWNEPEPRRWRDTQQVCLNGHRITDYAESQPDSRKNFCPDCGAATIMNCPSCNGKLRGHTHVPNVLAIGMAEPVLTNCPDCGHPYPWTEGKRSVLLEWLEISDSLSDEAKEEVRSNIEDALSDTGRTELAAHRIKRALSHADTEEAARLMKAFREAGAKGF